MTAAGWSLGLPPQGWGPGMEWTIRLEVKTGGGEVESLDLATITRPPVMAAAAA